MFQAHIFDLYLAQQNDIRLNWNFINFNFLLRTISHWDFNIWEIIHVWTQRFVNGKFWWWSHMKLYKNLILYFLDKFFFQKHKLSLQYRNIMCKQLKTNLKNVFTTIKHFRTRKNTRWSLHKRITYTIDRFHAENVTLCKQYVYGVR